MFIPFEGILSGNIKRTEDTKTRVNAPRRYCDCPRKNRWIGSSLEVDSDWFMIHCDTYSMVHCLIHILKEIVFNRDILTIHHTWRVSHDKIWISSTIFSWMAIAFPFTMVTDFACNFLSVTLITTFCNEYVVLLDPFSLRFDRTFICARYMAPIVGFKMISIWHITRQVYGQFGTINDHDRLTSILVYGDIMHWIHKHSETRHKAIYQHIWWKCIGDIPCNVLTSLVTVRYPFALSTSVTSYGFVFTLGTLVAVFLAFNPYAMNHNECAVPKWAKQIHRGHFAISG